MSKRDNILEQISLAKAKLANIDRNTSQLLEKKKNIEKQIVANQEKSRKIQFFLEKAQQTLQSSKL